MRRCCWLLALLLSGPLVAGETLERPDLSRYVRWGPFRARPGLQIRDFGYDDNILRARADVEPVSDLTITLSPGLEGLFLFGRRSFMTFDARADYTAYARETDQNFANLRLAGRLTVPISRAGLFVEGAAANTQQRPIDLESVRPESRRRALTLGGVLELGWRSELQLSRGRARLRYSDPDPAIARRLDRNETRTELAGSYRLKGRTALLVDLARIDVRFRDPAATVGEADERTARLGLRLGPGGPLSGTLRVGRSRVVAGTVDAERVRETVGEAQLVWRVGRQRLNLDFERSLGFSTSQTSRYYLSSGGSLVGTRFLNRLFGIDLRGSRRKLSFPGAGRTDRISRYGVGLRLRFGESSLGQRVEYVLRVERFERDSSDDLFDSDRTLVGLDAQFGF